MKLQYWLSPAAKTYDGQPQGIVKLSITLDGKESQFSTKLKIIKSDWSPKGSVVLPTDQEAEKKNAELRAITARTEEIETRLRQREKPYDVSTIIDVLRYLQSIGAMLEELRDSSLKAVLQKKEDDKKILFLDLLEKYRLYKNKRVEDKTNVNYFVFRRKIEKWLIDNKIFYAEDFTESVLLAITEWMEDDGMKGSSIKMYVFYYTGAMKHAKRKGLIENNPVSDFIYESKTILNHTYLTDAEMLVLDLLPNLSKKMEEVRDAFKFMCLTSVHYTDYMSLTSEYISAKGTRVWFEKPRDKTGVEFCQIIHPWALQIINKYGGKVENLPRFNYIDFYFSLIELGKLAKIKKHLTSKIGRKTFAYMALNKWGYSLEATAKMMGLNKTDTISYYAKVGRERVEKEVKWHTI